MGNLIKKYTPPLDNKKIHFFMVRFLNIKYVSTLVCFIEKNASICIFVHDFILILISVL